MKEPCPIYHVLLKGKRTMRRIHHVLLKGERTMHNTPCPSGKAERCSNKEVGCRHNLWAFSSAQTPNRTELNRTAKWDTYLSPAASEQCPGPLPRTCTAQGSKVITNAAYLSLPTSPSPHPPCLLMVIVAQLVLIFFYPVSSHLISQGVYEQIWWCSCKCINQL